MLTIENVKLTDIAPFAQNAKLHPKEQVAQIAASIREFGFNDPIAISETGEIIEGHGRFLAIRELGYTEVPCIRLSHLSEEQRRAYILAHNKLTMNTGFDTDFLLGELDFLKGADFDLALTGFDLAEVEKMFADANPQEIEEDDFDLEKAAAEPPFVLRGDLWTLGGRHRLLCGDATKSEDVRRLMDGKKANLLLTDPPYGVSYKGDAGTIQNDDMRGDALCEKLLRPAFSNAAEALDDDASAYIFHADTQGEWFRRAFREAGFKLSGVCQWVKPSLVLGRSPYQWQNEPVLFGWKNKGKHKWYAGRAETTIWHFDKTKKNDLHPTMKPLDLLAYPLKNSTAANAIVLDLFSGGGMFDLAAERAGIETVAMSEIEPFPIAVTRKHFPHAVHLGDINRIDGAKIPPADVVAGGFCCQDLSVAGKQAGLHGARSGLFFQMTRIIREMMAATDGRSPKYLVFENVPGLLSSQKGADFREVMDEIAALGFIADPNILDAQEFGVAQRRKRVFIVGINRNYYNPAAFADVPNARQKRMQNALDAWGGEVFHGIASRPHEVRRQHLSEILERETDLKYDLTPTACAGILRRVDAKGKVIPQLLRDALEEQAGAVPKPPADGEPMSFEPGATARLPRGKCWENIAPTLRRDPGDNLCSVAIPLDLRNATRVGGTQGVGVGEEGDPGFTVTARHQGAIALDNHPADSRIGISKDGNFQTITGRCGTGGGSAPMLAEPRAFGLCSVRSNAMLSPNPHAGVYETDTAKTLDTGSQIPCNQGGLVLCCEGNAARPSHRGNGVSEDISPTLNTVEQHTVCLTGYIVRRLTPIECLRLMGLPSDWCADLGVADPTEEDLAFWREVWAQHRAATSPGKSPKTDNQIRKFLRDPYTDGHCYALAGNGLCVPVAAWIFHGIVDYDNRL